MFIDFSIPKPFVSVSELPAALRRPQKKHALDFMSMYFICFVIFKRFQGPLVNKSKDGRTAQMTMPARRSSKFYTKRRAVLLPICFLSLVGRIITANIEPAPEYQPGNQINKCPRSIGLITHHVHKYPRSS